MLEQGNEYQGKLKRALTMRKRGHPGGGAGDAHRRCKASLRQNSFGNHTQPQQDQRKRAGQKKSSKGTEPQVKGLGVQG